MQHQTPYHLLGGESVLRQLVQRFYQEMDQQAVAARIRAMHPANLAHSEDKLFKFLSGWLGGPQLFIAEFGHPRLRARHLPFAIDSAARDAWLTCMQAALNQTPMEPALRQHLDQALFELADFMRNQPDAASH